MASIGDEPYREDEEPIYEEDSELPEEDQARLYAPLQAVVERNLLKQLEKLKVELAEKQTENRKLQRNREEIGVKLYGAQQQLAKVQMGLEKAHEDVNTVHKLRVLAEEKKQDLSRELQSNQEEIADLSSKRMQRVLLACILMFV